MEEHITSLKKEGVKVSFFIPKEWDDEIEGIARELQMSKSTLLRLAVKEFLERYKEKKRS